MVGGDQSRGRDPDTGKRKQVWHSGFATLAEATEARTRLLRERDTGAAIDPSRQTLAEYLRDEWLSEHWCCDDRSNPP